jgi:hypothetical protein
MTVRRWISIPAPSSRGLGPIVIALALVGGLGIGGFAFALWPTGHGPRAPVAEMAAAQIASEAAAGRRAPPVSTLGAEQRAPARPWKWM